MGVLLVNHITATEVLTHLYLIMYAYHVTSHFTIYLIMSIILYAVLSYL